MPQWLRDIWNAGGDILGTIKAFIFSLLDSMSSWIGDIVNWATNEFNAAYDYVKTIGDWAGRLVNESVSWLQNLMSSWISDVYKWASQAFNAASNFVTGTFNSIENWVTSLVNDLRNGINLIYDWAKSNIWDPLYGLIQDAWHFATVTLPNYITQIVGQLTQWVTDGIKWIWQYVGPVIDFFTHVLYDGWKVIEQAWDWITFFATHPISMGIQMVSDIVHGGFTGLVNKAVSAMESEGTHIMDVIANYLSV